MSRAHTVEVRFAESGDVPAICAIVNHYIAHDTSNLRLNPQEESEWVHDLATYGPRYPWLVAEEDGETVGLAYAKPWNPREAYDWTAESTIYIAPGQTGKGVGSALYERLFKLLERQGFHSVVAGVTSPNPGSEALHAAFGFRRVGVMEHAGYKFDTWYDVGYWQKDLAPLADPPRPTLAPTEV